jgi:FAD-linked sulfhydryl oxidase
MQQHFGKHTPPPHSHFIQFILSRLCAIHNKVNKRLNKPDFDCTTLDGEYDCGCGDTPIKPSNDPMDLEYNPSKDDTTGAGMIKGGR